jgi:hypothetical protein
MLVIQGKIIYNAQKKYVNPIMKAAGAVRCGDYGAESAT